MAVVRSRLAVAIFCSFSLLYGSATLSAQFEPLPSPKLPSPGTQHSVGSTTFKHSSFEADPSLIMPNQSAVLTGTGPTYPPVGTTATPWTWSGAGIAGISSSITAATPPDGNFAAFLQSSSATGVVAVSFAHALPAAGGVWRVSFLGAQRQNGANVDKQVVRVTILAQTPGGLVMDEVFNDPLRDSQYRTYYSRPFVAQATTITLLFEGTNIGTLAQTALLDRIDVRELMPWANSATWTWMGGEVPTPTDDVVVPADSCVGIVQGTANTIDLQGELFVLDAGQPGSLSTRLLEVHGEGSYFQVGLEGQPYLGNFTLVLDDDSTDSDPSVNALMVHDDAVVEMHGRPVTSWTHLAANASLGASSITVVAPIGWQVGDSIVIAASDQDFQHAEQRTITGITPAGATIGLSLNSPLSHFHCGTVSTVVAPFGNRVLDQRAEVGMLTHNVKVVGQPRVSNPPLPPGPLLS